jgi:hypothetical protein
MSTIILTNQWTRFQDGVLTVGVVVRWPVEIKVFTDSAGFPVTPMQNDRVELSTAKKLHILYRAVSETRTASELKLFLRSYNAVYTKRSLLLWR